jgi:CheY-like chemotaxis protein
MTRIWPEPTRVLVVEDDYLTARLISTRLAMDGLLVRTAVNGREALGALEAEPADLVVTDLMMPAMNGFRLIQEIRDLPEPQGRVPILVVSSNQNEQDMLACFSAGADDFMTKPISVPLLLERLWRLRHRGSAG